MPVKVVCGKAVCANCRKDWRAPTSPGRCPLCGQMTYMIIVKQ